MNAGHKSRIVNFKLDENVVKILDEMVREGLFENRSHAIRTAIYALITAHKAIKEEGNAKPSAAELFYMTKSIVEQIIKLVNESTESLVAKYQKDMITICAELRAALKRLKNALETACGGHGSGAENETKQL